MDPGAAARLVGNYLIHLIRPRAPARWEADQLYSHPPVSDASVRRRARVARVVLVPSPGRIAPLDYRVTPEFGPVAPGTRVLVPLGTRRSMGVVVEVHEDGA